MIDVELRRRAGKPTSIITFCNSRENFCPRRGGQDSAQEPESSFCHAKLTFILRSVDLAGSLGDVEPYWKTSKETIMSQNIIFALEEVGAINEGALQRQRAIRNGNQELQAAIEARRESLFIQMANDARPNSPLASGTHFLAEEWDAQAA